jgi:hypothetical protein
MYQKDLALDNLYKLGDSQLTLALGGHSFLEEAGLQGRQAHPQLQGPAAAHAQLRFVVP